MLLDLNYVYYNVLSFINCIYSLHFLWSPVRWSMSAVRWSLSAGRCPLVALLFWLLIWTLIIGYLIIWMLIERYILLHNLNARTLYIYFWGLLAWSLHGISPAFVCAHAWCCVCRLYAIGSVGCPHARLCLSASCVRVLGARLCWVPVCCLFACLCLSASPRLEQFRVPVLCQLVFACLHSCPFVCLSVCLLVRLSICLLVFVCLHSCPHVCLSVCVITCPFCLSVLASVRFVGLLVSTFGRHL